MAVARAITFPTNPLWLFMRGDQKPERVAGFSHTGAMAGPDELYDGMFRQAGVIRARSIVELFDFCWALGVHAHPQRESGGDTNALGGPGAAAADACGRAGLELSALSEERH